MNPPPPLQKLRILTPVPPFFLILTQNLGRSFKLPPVLRLFFLLSLVSLLVAQPLFMSLKILVDSSYSSSLGWQWGSPVIFSNKGKSSGLSILRGVVFQTLLLYVGPSRQLSGLLLLPLLTRASWGPGGTAVGLEGRYPFWHQMGHLELCDFRRVSPSPGFPR